MAEILSQTQTALTLNNCRVEWIDANTKEKHLTEACNEISSAKSVSYVIQEHKANKGEKIVHVIGIRVKGATVTQNGQLPRHFVVAIRRPDDISENLSDDSDVDDEIDENVDNEAAGDDSEKLIAAKRHGGRRLLKFNKSTKEWKVEHETEEDRKQQYFIYIFNLHDFKEMIPDQLVAIIQDEDIFKASHFVINDMKALAKCVDHLPMPANRQYIDVNMLVGWTLENDSYEFSGLNDLLKATINHYLPHKVTVKDSLGYSRIPKNTTQPEEAALETLAYLMVVEYCFAMLKEQEEEHKVKKDEIRKAFKNLKFLAHHG